MAPRPRIQYTVGDVISELTVIEVGLRGPLTAGLLRQGRKTGERAVRVRCSCGTEKIIVVGRLSTGLIKSCGHLEHAGRSHRTHGDSNHPHFDRWYNMMQRCYNVDHPAFKYYGARGIRVFAQWHDWIIFRDFLDHVLGPCPEGHSIDRINNDGDYEPGNIRWADRKTQANNMRGHGHLRAVKERPAS